MVRHIHVAQGISTIQQIQASLCVPLVPENGFWKIAVESMFPLGGLEIVVALTDQQLSIDFLGADQVIVKRFSAYGIPYLLK